MSFKYDHPKGRNITREKWLRGRLDSNYSQRVKPLPGFHCQWNLDGIRQNVDRQCNANSPESSWCWVILMPFICRRVDWEV